LANFETQFTNLPDDLRRIITADLHLSEINALSAVSHRFNTALNSRGHAGKTHFEAGLDSLINSRAAALRKMLIQDHLVGPSGAGSEAEKTESEEVQRQRAALAESDQKAFAEFESLLDTYCKNYWRAAIAENVDSDTKRNARELMTELIRARMRALRPNAVCKLAVVPCIAKVKQRHPAKPSDPVAATSSMDW